LTPDDKRLADRVEHVRGLAVALQQHLANLATPLEKDSNHARNMSKAIKFADK
jgi:hypothetical protein